MPVDDEVIDDETKLSVSEKAFIKTIARAKLLEDLSFDELLEELKRKYHNLVSNIVEEQNAMVVVKTNPATYQNIEQEQ